MTDPKSQLGSAGACDPLPTKRAAVAQYTTVQEGAPFACAAADCGEPQLGCSVATFSQACLHRESRRAKE